jgi:hypothetical protein
MRESLSKILLGQPDGIPVIIKGILGADEVYKDMDEEFTLKVVGLLVGSSLFAQLAQKSWSERPWLPEALEFKVWYRRVCCVRPIQFVNQ